MSWFAAQLGFTDPTPSGSGFRFQQESGGTVTIELRSEPGRSISLCEITSGSGSISVQRDQQGDFFRVEVRLKDGSDYQHLLPAGSNATTSLLFWEIGGGGRHQVYRKALAVLEQLV
jgi:hypothetical protein